MACRLGYNWQNGQLVYGIETDIQLSGADDTRWVDKIHQPWFGTLRGRGGFTFNNVLIYGTVGLAYGGLRGEVIGGATESKTLAGWTAGVGMEIGLTPAWSAKAEYLFMLISPAAAMPSPAPAMEWNRTFCASVPTIASDASASDGFYRLNLRIVTLSLKKGEGDGVSVSRAIRRLAHHLSVCEG